MHPIQAMINGMNAHWQEERSTKQMTLGKLIEALEALPPDTPVQRIGEPHSYRGYYSDLAFEFGDGTMPASEALALARSAMGVVFEGYKGGDFTMGERTPLWHACWGDCGNRLMALREDGTFETAPDEW